MIIKKLKKSYLALAAISTLGISVNANTFEDTLSSGKTSAEIRSVTVTS